MPAFLEGEEQNKWMDYWQATALLYKSAGMLELPLDLQFLFAIAANQPLAEIDGLIAAGANINSDAAKPHTPLSVARVLKNETIYQHLFKLGGIDCDESLQPEVVGGEESANERRACVK